MRRLLLNLSVLAGGAARWPSVLLCIGWGATAAFGQAPANDNFANAQLVVGNSGSVAGNNIGATSEQGLGELVIGGGSTVWYKWTSPLTGPVTFQTEGSSFDTVMAIWSGSALNNLNFIGFNDDVNYPSDATSRVTFDATNSVTYYIQVDGFGAAAGGFQGTILLSWFPQAVLAAGDFRFTTNSYLYTERESIAANNGFMLAAPQIGGGNLANSGNSANQGNFGPRVTISRFAGTAGRVFVNYTITNAFYTNTYQVSSNVTLISITNSAGGYTNIDITSVTSSAISQQDDEYGQFVTLPFFGLSDFVTVDTTVTDRNGVLNTNIRTSTGFTTNLFCLNSSSTDFVTNGNAVITSITNVLCLGQSIVRRTDPAATPGVDYLPRSGTVVFDDYQMSADIYPSIFANIGSGGGLLNTNSIVPNRALIVTIDSVQLDPQESPEIQPPISTSARTLVTISDLDTFPGTGEPYCDIINFERATLRCTRNVNGQTVAHVGVYRGGCSGLAIDIPYRIDFRAPSTPNGLNTFPLQAGSDYATPPNSEKYGTDPDFESVTGTVHWNQNDCTLIHNIDIPITNYNQVEFNEDILVQLYYPPGYTATICQGWFLGYQTTCNLTIVFDNLDTNDWAVPNVQPAGAVDRMYNMDNNRSTLPPYNQLPGANSTVYALASQPDGSTLIGGDFTAYNAVTRNRVARVLSNGRIDRSFDPGDGADKFVTSLVLDANQNILLAGAFQSVNRTPRNRIARLNSGGGLDTTFFPGQGANATIWQLALQNGTNILIAGEFVTFNGLTRNRIARLQSDGSLDQTFDPGAGPDGPIYSIAPQSDGRIIIGGRFTHVDGVVRSCIARLNSDGSLDASFNPRSAAGGDSPVVYALALQNDGTVLVGGNFSAMYGVSRNNIARLNADGSLDYNFNPGDAADDAVYSISVQTDGGIIIAGQFKSYNQTRRVGIARLYTDGSLDTTFMDTAYNQFAGIINHYYNSNVNPVNFILATSIQPDGDILIGGNFERVGGGFTRDDVRFRWNVARLVGGQTPGPGNIRLTTDLYTADDVGGNMFITLSRDNGHLGPASVTVQPSPLPQGPGVAIQGQDYIFSSFWANPLYNTTWSANSWQLQDGTFGQNQGKTLGVPPNSWFDYTFNDSYITILQSTNRGDKYLNLKLIKPNGTDIFTLGGENIPLGVALGKSLSQLEIVDSHRDHGTLSFSAPVYYSGESTNAIITVLRTGGSDGQVSVGYITTDGTATNGVSYNSVTNVLTFAQGVTNLTFNVPTRKEAIVNGDHTVNLQIYTPLGGAVLGRSNAVLVLVDDDGAGGVVEFTAPTFGTNENAGTALITVFRHVSSLGILRVWFSTSDGTATNGVNYSGTTNLLTWASGDITPKTIAIPVFDDGVPLPTNSSLTVNLRLASASLNSVTNDSKYLGTNSTAILSVTNVDLAGQVAFGAPVYSVEENGGFAIIPVVRTGGSAGSLSVNFATADATAFSSGPLPDYVATNGTLFFAPGELSKSFTVNILDNPNVDPARFLSLTLSGPSLAGAVGSPSTAILNIIDDESINQPAGSVDTTLDPAIGFNGDVRSLALQSDGSILAGGDFTQVNGTDRTRLARLNPDGSLDQAFSSSSASSGANDSILAILPQTDQRILIAGDFTTAVGVGRNYLARLTFSGFIDSTFNPGPGPNNPVFALAETFVGSVRKLLIGGAFTTYSSLPYTYIARLNEDGSIDPDFRLTPGANGNVYTIAVQSDGKAIIAGDFTTVNGAACTRIARLNVDGTLDSTFNPQTGPNDSVRALAVQLDGRILLGGAFTNVNGIALNRIARLNSDGSVDANFNPGTGLDDTVNSISLQLDTRIVLGGQFTVCNGVTRRRLTRLNPDGSVDTMINFGTGADGYVGSTLIQADGKIAFAGGFTSFNGNPAQHFSRIFGGSLAGAGSFEFDSATYQVDEVGTNALISIVRRGGTSGSVLSPNVSVHFSTANGTAIAGSNYVAISTNIIFAPGEVLGRFLVPVMRDFAITPDLTVNLVLSNPLPAAPDGPSLGNQSSAVLTIYNDDSDISFGAPAAYSTPENPATGIAFIPVVRSGSFRIPASVVFLTTTNGTAVANTNYVPVTNTLTFIAGQVTNLAEVQMLYDPRLQGNTTLIMELTNAVNALLFEPSLATLTIVDVDRAPGQFLFTQTNYNVGEADGIVRLTVLRTNGHSGAVTVSYATVPGTATPGYKYTGTNGSLSFGDGETSKDISVAILEEGQVEGNTTFSVRLSNPIGGASFAGPTSAAVTIFDDDIGVGFSSPIYIANETDGSIVLTVNRVGTNGVTTVNYATTNGTAIAGINYVAASGVLSFTNGEAFKTFQVPLLYDTNVTGGLAFGVTLSNPSNFPPAQVQIFNQNPATVDILDANPGIFFTNANFYTVKSATNVLITVVRSNANTGTVSVNYATSDGTATNGINYVAVNGLLTFSNGVTLQTFTVPIRNNRQVEGDRTFNINLLNPTGGAQLLTPSVASVTITDDIAGISFSSPVYSVNENGVSAAITVLRSGFTNSTVSVDFATADGSGKAGANYLSNSGTLVFTNGETVKTFVVTVVDNGVVDGDRSVLLGLNNVVGNALLLTPSAAVLNMIETDGSLIIPAGVALVSESGPVNGIIDTNETVTVLFALRDVSGTNTVNLTATLLATNGLTNPSEPQNYGALAIRGHSVSRPFTFTANGTNGQVISAILQLRDGNTPLTNAAFNFVLGQGVNTYSNVAPIFIPDRALSQGSGPASQYPSIINVSGIGNSVIKATVTFTNLNHTWPSDIDALLVSPTGLRSYLMAKAGSTFAINNTSLTFDDAATTSLPRSSQIISSTNRPTSYAVAPPPFPTPAPPAPYATNLSVFNGSNANGQWSLFIFDDNDLNFGVLSNGWRLSLTTAAIVPVSADVGVTMTVSPAVAIDNNPVTYSISVTNYGPGTASGIVITDVLPAGAGYVTNAPFQGSIQGSTISNGVVTWSIAALGKDAYTNLTLVITNSLLGVTTNTVIATTTTSDPNPDNDSARAVNTIITPSADLAVTLVGVPNPILPGGILSYTITVTNLGPAPATAVSFTDTLPAGLIFLYGSPTNSYTFASGTVTFTNLGSLASGAGNTATIVVQPTVYGTLTNTASASSAVVDPFKANNSATVKTVVSPVQLTVVQVGSNFRVSWDAAASFYVLETTTTLNPPNWTAVATVSGQTSVSIPIGSGTQFFRLRAPTH